MTTISELNVPDVQDQWIPMGHAGPDDMRPIDRFEAKNGLIYCRACGYPIWTERHGVTERALFKPCQPSRIDLRGAGRDTPTASLGSP